MKIPLTDENFQKEVLENRKPVIVEVSAHWSGSTHIIKPILKRMAMKYNRQIIFGDLNIDTNKKTVREYCLTTVPVIMVFNNGNIVDQLSGVFSNNDLEKLIKTVLHS